MNGKSLPRTTIEVWRRKAENLFQQHVEGYYLSPVYRIEGAFHSASGKWIRENNYVIKTYARAADCRKLIRALERDLIPQMGVSMAQESIAIESSVEGLAIYNIFPDEDDDKDC